ncbi:hypothetical protein KCU93_g4251, partial [Aureobasidium melanogenum]
MSMINDQWVGRQKLAIGHPLMHQVKPVVPGDHPDQHNLPSSAQSGPVSQEQIKVTVEIVLATQISGTSVTSTDQGPTIATTSHTPSESLTYNFKTTTTNGSSTPRTNGNTTYDLDVKSPSINISNIDDLNGDYYTLCKTPSPPPQRPLRQRLVGTWRLEAYVAYPTPSCRFQRSTFPMTKNVTGLIMYTPDGYMSAHMLIPGQMSFKRGEGEEPQWAEAGKRSFSYAGPYYITNEGMGREEILRHTFQVCNLPGWLGDVQIRTWKFEEDDNVLVLGSEEPTEIRGEQRIPVLKWRRVMDNSNGSPPAPMPHIKVSGPGEP